VTEEQRSKAIPVWGPGEIPADREHRADEDVGSFADVVKIFFRTWPFLLPLALGYWRERAVLRRTSWGARDDSEWNYRYVPLLVTALVLLGPLTGWLSTGISWQRDALFYTTVVMGILSWVLIFTRGRQFLWAAVILVVVGFGAVLFSILVVAGWTDNVQVGLVTFGCLTMWLLQYRVSGEQLQVRLRVGSHLVYYYALVWLTTLLGIVTGLFTIDLLNQSILQAKPLTPFLAGFISRPELGSGAIETLSIAERQQLQWIYVVFVVAIGAITYPLSQFIRYYNVWIMQQINQDLRLALVERWHQLSLRYHGDHRVGDSVYRIYQDSAQVTAIIGMLISVSTQLSQYAVTLVFIAALDPYLGVIGITIGIFAIAWARWFSPRVRTRSLTARETNSDLTSRVQEVLGAVRVIKAYGREGHEQERFEADSVIAFNAAHRVRSLVAIVGIIMFTIAAALLLGAEFMMALWASSDRETFAAVLIGLVGLSFVRWNLGAFQWAQAELFQTSNRVRGLVRDWTSAQDMAMGLGRVFEILDIEPEVKNAPDAVEMPPFRDEIRFEDVSFAYEPDRPVLRSVSLTASPGTITAVIGPTGCGKSTMVNLLTRLFDPDSGRITIDGLDLRQIDIESLRANVSIALQENVLFGMSVRDNIRYVVPDASDEAVMAAAHVACAEEYISSLPEGLDTVLGDRGGKLSTGQRQRLSIARALVRNAPILILDEPTAALDAETEHQVLERLGEWARGASTEDGHAIFLITHRISTIQQADQIIYMDRGEILERGSHAELMSIDGGHYRQFVETEAELSGGGAA
jgi:ABC-type multidrug transport system fused ATPase/permease subunit